MSEGEGVIEAMIGEYEATRAIAHHSTEDPREIRCRRILQTALEAASEGSYTAVEIIGARQVKALVLDRLLAAAYPEESP